MEGKAPTGLYITLGIVLAVLGLVLLVRKDVLSYFTGLDVPERSEEEVEQNVDDLVEGADPVITEPVNDDFTAQALAIADSQYLELSQYSQDEFAMLAQLENLDGGQLLQVFEQFGARLYDPFFGGITYLNLFDFYGEQLDNTWLYGQLVNIDWDDYPEEWRPTDINACDGLYGNLVGCTEKEAFRAIWWRSGLPLTF